PSTFIRLTQGTSYRPSIATAACAESRRRFPFRSGAPPSLTTAEKCPMISSPLARRGKRLERKENGGGWGEKPSPTPFTSDFRSHYASERARPFPGCACRLGVADRRLWPRRRQLPANRGHTGRDSDLRKGTSRCRAGDRPE